LTNGDRYQYGHQLAQRGYAQRTSGVSVLINFCTGAVDQAFLRKDGLYGAPLHDRIRRRWGAVR